MKKSKKILVISIYVWYNFSKSIMYNVLYEWTSSGESTLSFEKKSEVSCMANKTELRAYEIGDEIAEAQGVSLICAEYKKEGNEYFLRLAIDKEGGVGIDECELFSRAFSDKMDELDPIKEAYVLEVTSPGVDRKLTTEREFAYYIGREVEVKLYAQGEFGKEFTGVLKGFEDSVAKIETNGKITDIPLKEAVYIRLYFKF